MRCRHARKGFTRKGFTHWLRVGDMDGVALGAIHMRHRASEGRGGGRARASEEGAGPPPSLARSPNPNFNQVMPSFFPSKGTDGPWVDPSLGDAQACAHACNCKYVVTSHGSTYYDPSVGDAQACAHTYIHGRHVPASSDAWLRSDRFSRASCRRDHSA
jgi:hypothetical protein